VSEFVGLGGRIGIGGFSLGGAIAESGDGGVLLGPPSRKASAGYDLSYSFGFGAVSLSRFHGTGEPLLGAPTQTRHKTLALTGRYLIGNHLDVMALLAHRTAGHDDPDGATDGDDWALMTGMRLSF
jgi:hypothetical protein